VAEALHACAAAERNPALLDLSLRSAAEVASKADIPWVARRLGEITMERTRPEGD
jgi:hypothetical protein